MMIFSIPAGPLLLQHRQRLVQWCRLLAGYSFVMAVTQALGFLSGILVVRALSKEDYACFVIVNTIGPAMNLLSDNGITSSLSAIGGRFWQDDLKMGSLINTAMVMRRRLVLSSAAVVTPVLVYMLLRNHARTSTIVWLVLITLAGVYFQLNAGVLNAVVNLRQQVGRMQLLGFSGVLPRLLMVALLAAFGLLNAPLAAAAGTVAFATQFALLEYWVKPQISRHAPPDAGYRNEIWAIVKKQAPLTIYFCLQSQIGILLISIFGNVHRVAEVGALGRIGMIFSILVMTISALVIPRFARCQDPVRLRLLYVFILLGCAAAVLLGTALAWAFPASLLWLLGAQYAHLTDLVWLAVLTAGVSAWGGLLYSLNVNKGWIPPAAIFVPVELAGQIILCLIFDLSSVRGILLIGALAPVLPSLINFLVGLRKLNALAKSA